MNPMKNKIVPQVGDLILYHKFPSLGLIEEKCSNGNYSIYWINQRINSYMDLLSLIHYRNIFLEFYDRNSF